MRGHTRTAAVVGVSSTHQPSAVLGSACPLALLLFHFSVLRRVHFFFFFRFSDSALPRMICTPEYSSGTTAVRFFCVIFLFPSVVFSFRKSQENYSHDTI